MGPSFHVNVFLFSFQTFANGSQPLSSSSSPCLVSKPRVMWNPEAWKRGVKQSLDCSDLCGNKKEIKKVNNLKLHKFNLPVSHSGLPPFSWLPPEYIDAVSLVKHFNHDKKCKCQIPSITQKNDQSCCDAKQQKKTMTYFEHLPFIDKC